MLLQTHSMKKCVFKINLEKNLENIMNIIELKFYLSHQNSNNNEKQK